MQRPLLLLGVCLSAAIASAQAPFFSLYHDEDTLEWSHNFLIEASNGDIVQVCRMYELDPDTNYLIFRRFDANGNLLAATRVIPPTGIALQMYDGVELPDGTFLLIGTDDPYGVLVHLDAMGALISVRRRSGTTITYYENMIWMNDSTLLAIGLQAILDDHKLLLSRFDQAGNHLGSVGVRMDGQGAYGTQAVRSSAGGVLLCASGEDTAGVGRSWLLRLDDQGEVLWAKSFRDSARATYPFGLAEDGDGNIWMGGSLWSMGINAHQYLMKLDADGDPLFAHEYNTVLSPAGNMYGRSFSLPSDTSALFTGHLDSGCYIMAVDTSGMPVSSSTIDVITMPERPLLSGAGDLLIPVVAAAPTAGVALGVWRTSDPFGLSCTSPLSIVTSTFSPVSWQDFTVETVTMTFDDITSLCIEGQNNWIAYDPCLPDIVRPRPADEADLRIWPVPAADRITIEGASAGWMEVLDQAGRSAMTGPIGDDAYIEMDLGGLAPGMYQLLVHDDAGLRARKFIKQ